MKRYDRINPISSNPKLINKRIQRNIRAFSLYLCILHFGFIPLQSFGQNSSASSSDPLDFSEAPLLTNVPTTYKRMSLDELLNVQVTSVTRREGTVRQSPAAVYVITQDDIHRSGVTTIAEALRMAPGLEVARASNNAWAISSRGFNSRTSNKLLVLMDGRTVYSPLYAGVFWDVQDTMMEDINQIEVIRGPAGTLWGANAVNGVVNVITKDAKETQGLLASAGAGTEELEFQNVRYGWKLGENAHARVYSKHSERDESKLSSRAPGKDDSTLSQGGYRVDWEPYQDDHFTFQGDAYRGDQNNLSSDDTTTNGANALARWTHKFDQGNDLKLQIYYDRTERDIPTVFQEDRNTFDIDFQHHIAWGDRNDITWGLGYRLNSNEVEKNTLFQLIPNHRDQQLASAFIQDEITLIPDAWKLTLGTKLERNDFTGFEFQPGARLLWVIDKKQSAWAAISRAVRTPTQLEEDLFISVPSTVVLGNRDFTAEEVIAYELGYRVQPMDYLTMDIATFYNDYDKLRSVERQGANSIVANNLNGQTFGAEVGSTLKPVDWWTWRAAYTYLEVHLDLDSDSSDSSSVATEGNDPRNQFYLRSSMDLPCDLKLDCTLRFVDELENQKLPAYLTSDARLAWQANQNLELALVGQNLLDNQHPEFGTGATRREIERSVYGTMTFRW